MVRGGGGRAALAARGFLTERLPAGAGRADDLDRVWGPMYHAVVRAQPDRFQPPGRYAAAPVQAAVALFPPDGHCYGAGGPGKAAAGPARAGPPGCT